MFYIDESGRVVCEIAWDADIPVCVSADPYADAYADPYADASE
jgi:hypothetical protein